MKWDRVYARGGRTLGVFVVRCCFEERRCFEMRRCFEERYCFEMRRCFEVWYCFEMRRCFEAARYLGIAT